MFFSWKIGRVAGVDLYLHPTFLLLLLYVGATQGGLLAMLLVSAVFGCVLLHELGHALAARLYGIATQDITLYPIGGVARLARMPRKPGPELVIALAGPAVNLAIAGVLWTATSLGAALVGTTQSGSLAMAMLNLLCLYNLLLAGFNLIPAFPMDGGRVFRALLTGWMGRLRATEAAASLGRWLAFVFGAWNLMQGNLIHVLLAVFVFMAAGAELARVRFEEQPWGDDPTGGRGGRWIYQGNGTWRLATATPTGPTPHHRGAARPWL